MHAWTTIEEGAREAPAVAFWIEVGQVGDVRIGQGVPI
jgi:hypothetical protein